MRSSLCADTLVSLGSFSLWGGSQWVLRNVSLSVRRGSFCVVLGGNGAGKSSLLKAMAGVLQPPWEKFGLLQIHSNAHEEARVSLSWLPQSLGFSEDLTVREFLALQSVVQQLRSQPGEDVPAAADEFGVIPLLDRRLSALSGGQWQRVRLARALGREATLLLLDEPDTALDAAWRKVLWAALAQRMSRGATVVVALHRITEVGDLVDCWCGMEHGRMVFVEDRRETFPEALVERLFLEKGLTR